MANNRLYLCCTICADDPEKSFDEACRYFLKYYPSSGWYVPSEMVRKPDGVEVSRITSLNEWLDTHKHGTMYGQYLTLIDEASIPDQAADFGRDVIWNDGERRSMSLTPYVRKLLAGGKRIVTKGEA